MRLKPLILLNNFHGENSEDENALLMYTAQSVDHEKTEDNSLLIANLFFLLGLTDLTHRLTLKVKRLFAERFEVVAILDGDRCPVEDFLNIGEKSTKAYREGLTFLLQHFAENGLQNVSSALVHEAGTKQQNVLQIVKGSLRLFFFHGSGRQIAVCVGGARKTGRRADKQLVAKVAAWRARYFHAVEQGQLETQVNED